MSQSLSVVYIHAVFSTKERRGYLQQRDLRERTHAYLAGVSNRLKCPTIIVGGVEDHVHHLFRLHRSVSQAEWVKEIKRSSTLWIRGQISIFNVFCWQAGYGMFSVGRSEVGMIRHYIGNQQEHHRKVSFQDEFRTLLKEHGEEWDERYVWD